RMAFVDLGLPVAADEERGCRAKAPHDVLKAFDRDLGRVQVLEDEDEGLAGGPAGERPGEQVEYLDPPLDFALAGRECGSRVAARRRPELADLGQQREEREELGREIGDVRPVA